MKIKTSELIGPALDWAVAKAEYTDRRVELSPYGGVYFETSPGSGDRYNMGWTYARFSTDWSQGGPIIEREGISWHCGNKTSWHAYGYGSNENFSGPTPLIAAMRCYVASKLGDIVKVPKEMNHGA